MKVIIATQAYNAENYLAETIESVLKQTYTNFTYLLIDSASTDSTPEIIQEYAKKDSRIKYIHFDVNALGRCEQCAAKEDGDYYMAIDSDDLLEPDCLERMLETAVRTEVDIVVTGSRIFDDDTGKTIKTKRFEQPFIFFRNDYAQYYRCYHWYFRAIWAKLYKIEVLKSVDVEKIVNSPLFYGKDTLFTFQALRNTESICIDNTCLHHYRIRQSSVSYKYRFVQHDSDVLLFNDAIDFLKTFGEISVENIAFINSVYTNACRNTLRNLVKSELTPDEKIKECLRIMSNEVSQNVLLQDFNQKYELKAVIYNVLNQNAAKIKPETNDFLTMLVNQILVNCKNIFDPQLMPLFIKEPEMWDAFIRDEAEELLEIVLALISKCDEYIDEYNLSSIVLKLIPKGTLLSNIKDERFYYFYPLICRLLLGSENTQALSEMTEILFSGNELDCAEDFLNLYVKLAALENHVDAFLFGNIQKAYLFIDEKRFDEARQIVNDLIEMGAGETEDIIEIVKLLK